LDTPIRRAARPPAGSDETQNDEEEDSLVDDDDDVGTKYSYGTRRVGLPFVIKERASRTFQGLLLRHLVVQVVVVDALQPFRLDLELGQVAAVIVVALLIDIIQVAARRGVGARGGLRAVHITRLPPREDDAPQRIHRIVKFGPSTRVVSVYAPSSAENGQVGRA